MMSVALPQGGWFAFEIQRVRERARIAQAQGDLLQLAVGMRWRLPGQCSLLIVELVEQAAPAVKAVDGHVRFQRGRGEFERVARVDAGEGTPGEIGCVADGALPLEFDRGWIVADTEETAEKPGTLTPAPGSLLPREDDITRDLQVALATAARGVEIIDDRPEERPVPRI